MIRIEELELIKNNVYHFYYKNREMTKTKYFKAKYIGTFGKVMQIWDLKVKDYCILPVEDTTVTPIEGGLNAYTE